MPKNFAVPALVDSSDDVITSLFMSRVGLLFKLLCAFDRGLNIVYDVLFIFSDNLLQHSHVYTNSSWIFTLHIKSSMLDPDL